MPSVTLWKRYDVRRPSTWPVFIVVTTVVLLIAILFFVWTAAAK